MKRFFKKDNYYFMYSIVFVFVFLIAFSQFFLNGNSFISTWDGIRQHYTSLVYFGQYIREIIKTLFMQGELVVPAWDFSLAMGADILTTLHYYAIGDPLNLLYAAVPAAYSEYLYGFLLFIRLYLSGITFSIYSRKWNKHNLAVLCGALVYVFCYYTYYQNTVHPFFANPMIYLPLLFLGIEMIYEKKSPTLFIVMVFISAISNFYFFYVLSLMMFIYAAVRFFFIFKEHRIRNLFLQLRNFIGYYCIAVLGSCAILFPVIMATLNSNRVEISPNIDLFYSPAYYASLLPAFLSPVRLEYRSSMTWGCVPLLLLFLLFLRKKGVFSQLKIGVALCLLFTLLPVSGYVFNGFSYVTNRWMLAFGFLIGLLAVFLLEELETISAREWRILMFLSILYVIITLLANKDLLRSSKICLVFLIFCIGAIGAARFLHISKTAFCTCCLALICTNIFINTYYMYSPTQQNILFVFLREGRALTSITESSVAAIPPDDEPFYRYGDSITMQDIPFDYNYNYNTAAISHKFSTCGYYSLLNGNTTKYFQEILSTSGMSNSIISGFDDRAIPQTLANTKYYVLTDDQKRYRPYGYSRKVNTYETQTRGPIIEDFSFHAWENRNYLPFGYTYDSFFNTETWDSLNFLEKQEAMLQACHITDSEQVTVSENSQIKFDNVNLPFKIECGEGITYEKGRIIVSEPGATLNIHFQGMPESETYFHINNLGYEVLDGSGDVYPDSAFIDVSMGNSQKTVCFYTEVYNWYDGMRDFALNMGYKKKSPGTMTLLFQQRGVYTFDDLSIYALPMKNYREKTGKLKENVLENVELVNNGVNGEIDLEESRILCLTIPYGKGWKGYVDGREVPLLQANTMYTGINLDAGHHEIRLRYHTPYLGTGIILSILGILCFIALLVWQRKKRRNVL